MLNREAIFMGELLEADCTKDGLWPIDFIELSPHQCRENWGTWLQLAVEHHEDSGADWQVFADYLQDLLWRSTLLDLYQSEDLAIEMFDLVIGDKDDINNYHFMGRRMPHPFEPSRQNAVLGAYHMADVLKGKSIYGDVSERQYFYTINALSIFDEEIFYPESMMEYLDDTIDVKIAWAAIFHTLYHYDEKMYKRTKRDGDLAQPFKQSDFKTFQKDKQLVAFRKRLLRDLEKGVMPKSMKDLHYWAQGPWAHYLDLRRSSRADKQQYYTYSDPWVAPVVEEYVEEESESLLVTETEPEVSVQAVVDACEQIRKKLHKSRVPNMSNKLKTEDDLRVLLSELGWSGKKNISNEIADKQNDPKWSNIVSMMCTGYYSYFYGTGFADGYNANLKDHERYLLDAVDNLRTIVKTDVTIGKAHVERIIAFNERRLILKIEVKRKTYTYEYNAVDWEMSDHLMSDFMSLLRAEKAPWLLHYDEENDLLYYLPKACSTLLINADWG